MTSTERTRRIIARCRELARISDVEGETTRLFLSPRTRDAHTLLSWWMREAGLAARVDDMGNVRALRAGAANDSPVLVLFSHIDTVPNAGAFDGPLGVMLALEAIDALGATELPFAIELVAFSEEEGVRFAFPFLSSRAAVGQLEPEMLDKTDAQGVSVVEAITAFGLNPARAAETAAFSPHTFGALEVHIEQGPVLEAEDRSLAVVEAICGQSRLRLTFEGVANHAGTTPMALRRDALVAAAEFVVEVSRYASSYTQLVATVGKLDVLPGAMNIVPGSVTCTLDVRHPRDESRHAAVAHLLTRAQHLGEAHGVRAQATMLSEQRAVPMDPLFTQALHHAAERTGHDALQLFSGAGHDSMIIAPHVPTAMLFVRSPGGVSHNPAEDVRAQDVEAALETVVNLLMHLHRHA